MADAAITLEAEGICVRGSGFGDGGKLNLLVVSTARNGDYRSARHRPWIAHAFSESEDRPTRCIVCGQLELSHTYASGDVDFNEPLAFADGTIRVELFWDAAIVAEETFYLG